MKNELFICNLNYICTILLIKYDIFLSCFWEINVSYVFVCVYVSSCCTNWNICKSNVIFQPCATWRGIQSRGFPGKLRENYLKEKFNHLLLINQLLLKDFSFKRDSSSRLFFELRYSPRIQLWWPHRHRRRQKEGRRLFITK